MARQKRWKESRITNGITTVELFDWKYFNDYIYHELLDYSDYIFRGHRREDWKLESTLDRAPTAQSSEQRTRHLAKFKLAVRGRRGPNPAKLENDNDWWALGQHHGLKTPLLDWTRSPFVAAYFAFVGKKEDDTQRRVIWALDRSVVKRKSERIAAATTGKMRPSIVEFFTPHSDENARLVNQGGLFTRAPDGMTIEEWLEADYSADEAHQHTMVAIKLTVPSANRTDALRSLNRMNINHLTLFPDLFGASAFCNTDLEIPKY